MNQIAAQVPSYLGTAVTLDHPSNAGHPPITLVEAVAYVADRIGPVRRRQLRVVHLDARRRPLEFQPSPEAPHPGVATYGAVRKLAYEVHSMACFMDAAALLLVWERPQSALSTMLEREWARELSGTLESIYGIRVEGQLIAHKGGMRWFHRDEFTLA